MEELKENLNDWKIWLLLSLTLGLAPFMPEPHLFGKIKWVFGGACGMQVMDWLDLLFHGAPWILLIRSLMLLAAKKRRAQS